MRNFAKKRCDVKLESYKNRIIKKLVKKKRWPYTPQFKKKFKIEGQKRSEIKKLLNEARLIEKAGAFSIVLECISSKAARIITNNVNIPTIGIGSSTNCDGQILVTDDMLGISGFYPKFVKKYVNLNRIIEKAVKKYTREVKIKKFPTNKNIF